VLIVALQVKGHYLGETSKLIGTDKEEFLEGKYSLLDV